VLALIRALAEAAVPDADRRAYDRQLDDAEQRRGGARCVASSWRSPPIRNVAGAALAARLAGQPGAALRARASDVNE
jgi:hypothetical protein